MGPEGINLRLAVAKSRLATSFLTANVAINKRTLHYWARKAKHTIKSAYKIALQSTDFDLLNLRSKTTSLILADIRRIMTLTEECIVCEYDRKGSRTYFNRMKSVMRSHDNLLCIYKQSYKPDHLIIATTLENKARIYTHLIQHENMKKNFTKVKEYYDCLKELLIETINMKESVLGKNDIRINGTYRFLGKYYLHRFQDLFDVCELEKAEDLFKKCIKISLQWIGEYDCGLGVAYSNLSYIYSWSGMLEECHDFQDK